MSEYVLGKSGRAEREAPGDSAVMFLRIALTISLGLAFWFYGACRADGHLRVVPCDPCFVSIEDIEVPPALGMVGAVFAGKHAGAIKRRRKGG